MRGKTVAMLMVIIICILLCSCTSEKASINDSEIEDSDAISAYPFPLKENGYPDVNYISVNGKAYLTQIGNRDTVAEEIIEVSNNDISDDVVIILPQCVNILKWNVKDSDTGVELLENKKTLPDLNGEYVVEGESPYLYEFVFAVTDRKQMEKIVFELVNVDSSVVPDCYYTLTLSFGD